MSRIYQYPVVTEISNDDYLALGSATNGSRSILASDLAPVIGNKTITERGTYKASDDGMDGYGQVTVDIPYTDIHVASGDIATFEGEDLPLKSLKVAVTPYQDLHGYDSPWVGGAGKNKINLADIATASTGFVYNREPVSIAVNTYTLSFNFIGNSGSISISLRNGETVVSTLKDQPLFNGLNTYTLPILSDNADFISLYAGTSGTYKNFMLNEGSTALPYEPYSNICPIIGWDEAVVTRTGKNLFDVNEIVDLALGGTILQADNYRGWYMPVHNGETFTISRKNISTSNRFRICFTTELPANGVPYYNNIGSEGFYIDGDNLTQITTTVPNDKTYKFIFIYLSNIGETITESSEIQVELGTTATPYEPYNGATYTIDLNGTRYGGTLDATDGTFLDMIDHIASYNGEELPPAWISDRDVYAVGTTPTIGAEVVYPRATPITVQLAPTQVKSLVGKNNIFANCGAVDVEYQTVWVRPSN